MLDKAQVAALEKYGRTIEPAKPNDKDLGPLELLQGSWANEPNLPGRGWNMIALPFATQPGAGFDYRLLLNQYNETLDFKLVDKGVPNRGISKGSPSTQTDQFIATLDYLQAITQVAAEDSPVSGKAGGPNLAIHKEPGLWLHMANETTDGLDIARLGSIPHGDTVLALGRSASNQGAPNIPAINGLPIGVSPDVDNNPYLAPYKHFHDNLFRNLFDPTLPNALLTAANTGVDIARTTELTVDTTLETGGVVNIPFITQQANAAEMRSTFWIQELEEQDSKGNPKLRLQYSQVVMLDFFERRDGMPGLIRWPHISINTMEKIA